MVTQNKNERELRQRVPPQPQSSAGSGSSVRSVPVPVTDHVIGSEDDGLLVDDAGDGMLMDDDEDEDGNGKDTRGRREKRTFGRTAGGVGTYIPPSSYNPC